MVVCAHAILCLSACLPACLPVPGTVSSTPTLSLSLSRARACAVPLHAAALASCSGWMLVCGSFAVMPRFALCGGGGGRYSNKQTEDPDINDPRLAGIPMGIRKALLAQLTGGNEPNIMRNEPCAITCRVAPSFFRVGHLELFGRRAKAGLIEGKRQLELSVKHLLFREFPSVASGQPGSTLEPEHVLGMLEQASVQIARLTADWIRVGFCQGNFNSDNCLIAGRTMDYGPFGFLEKYKPDWNMWIGGGRHYSFMNQPDAGGKNFNSLVNAVMPLLEGEAAVRAQAIGDGHMERAVNATNDVWARKMGLKAYHHDLFVTLEILMQKTPCDYSILWRQLASLPAAALGNHGAVSNTNLHVGPHRCCKH